MQQSNPKKNYFLRKQVPPWPQTQEANPGNYLLETILHVVHLRQIFPPKAY